MIRKVLYLDHNIISYLRKKEDVELNYRMKSAYESGWVVAFSPAHLEEIAVSEKQYDRSSDEVNEEISFLSTIAGRNSLSQLAEKSCEFYDESPDICYQRVVDKYDVNDVAEKINKGVIHDAHDNPWGCPKELNNLNPEDVLNNFIYKEEVIKMLMHHGMVSRDEVDEAFRWSFSDLKDKFYVFSAYVEVAARIVEKKGYFRERRENYRSNLHDVSHIIYAAYCTVFVSSDKKLLKKARAIYSMLNIPTKVMTKSEFILKNDG